MSDSYIRLDLQVGDRIKTIKNSYYDVPVPTCGTITRRHSLGCYDVQFDNGISRMYWNVIANEYQLLEKEVPLTSEEIASAQPLATVNDLLQFLKDRL